MIFEELTTEQLNAIDLILNGSASNQYSAYFLDVADVLFELALGSDAGIVIGQSSGDTAASGGITYNLLDNATFTSGSHNILGLFGDIWLNQDFANGWNNAGDEGSEQFFISLHELSHAVGGLKDASDVSTVDDSQYYTVMSYKPMGWSRNSARERPIL